MSDSEDQQRKSAELDYAAYTAEAADRVRFQINLVDRGIQSLMYMNGGALVALFTLFGHSSDVFHHRERLWVAFGFFVAGLAFTALANMCAFFSQVYFAQVTQLQAWDAQRVIVGAKKIENVKPAYLKGQIAQGIGIFAAFAALAGFALGCGFAFGGTLPS